MTIAGKIIRFISGLFKGLSKETKRLAPIAIAIVQAVKSVMDSPVDDIILAIIKKSIPGNADDILIDKITATIKEWLPKILVKLSMAEAIAAIEDPNEQLKAVLDKFKFADDETRNLFYHNFCFLIMQKLSDGKIDWSTSILAAEVAYKEPAILE